MEFSESWIQCTRDSEDYQRNDSQEHPASNIGTWDGFKYIPRFGSHVRECGTRRKARQIAASLEQLDNAFPAGECGPSSSPCMISLVPLPDEFIKWPTSIVYSGCDHNYWARGLVVLLTCGVNRFARSICDLLQCLKVCEKHFSVVMAEFLP